MNDKFWSVVFKGRIVHYISKTNQILFSQIFGSRRQAKPYPELAKKKKKKKKNCINFLHVSYTSWVNFAGALSDTVTFRTISLFIKALQNDLEASKPSTAIFDAILHSCCWHFFNNVCVVIISFPKIKFLTRFEWNTFKMFVLCFLFLSSSSGHCHGIGPCGRKW